MNTCSEIRSAFWSASHAIIAVFSSKRRHQAVSGTLLALLAISLSLAAPAGATPSAPAVSSMAGGSDNVSRLAWANSDSTFTLWHAVTAGPATFFNYGPYPNWSPAAVATGGNNAPRVMWNEAKGMMSLWSMNESTGAYSSNNYGPYIGWKAVSLGIGGNNVPRVMWNATDGTMALWSINTAGAFAYHNFGPFPGWTASYLAVGPNNIPRVLWARADGTVSLWANADSNAPLRSYVNYGPFAGWTAISMAVDSNNAPRILWNHAADGTASLWTVAADSSFVYHNYTAPAGYTAKGIGTGSAGSVTLLWTKPDGTAQLWVINADGTVASKTTYPSLWSFFLSPASVIGGAPSVGTVTLNSPALPGGMTVTLSSDNSLATVPATVVVPAGMASATFPITTSYTSGATANISATVGGVTKTAALSLLSPINPKKGIGGRESAGAALRIAWYYTWGSGEPTDAAPGIEFVPMEWGYYGGDNTAWVSSIITQPGVKNILAFNEPDHPDQANLTVPYALTGYQYLSNAVNASNGAVQLGSPACADDNDQWFTDFMAGAATNNYRVDFIAVHDYIRDPYQSLAYIDGLWNTYHKPIWVTEFAPADWSGTNPVSVAEAEAFMNIVVPGFNQRSYVARFAWYTGANPGATTTLSSAGLVWPDGSLDELGILYSKL